MRAVRGSVAARYPVQGRVTITAARNAGATHRGTVRSSGSRSAIRPGWHAGRIRRGIGDRWVSRLPSEVAGLHPTSADLYVCRGHLWPGSRHNGRVRFEVSKVLDAIEHRLALDPAIASGVLDLGEVVRLGDLDGGRPANLLRLGMLVDALGQRLGDSSATVYVVADRALLADTELSS